jgi:putative nucleotidyltransferase with HDIG domain
MPIFEDLRSGLSPAAEELHEGFDEVVSEPLRGRELRVECLTTCIYLLVAAAMAATLDGGREFDPVLAAALVGSYALASRIRFAIGYGYTVPTQVLFVPMLFLLPVGAVPLLVTAGILLGALPDVIRGDLHPSRLIVATGDSWHAVGPALVLGLAGVTKPELAEWPLLVAALCAQIGLDALVSTLREWIGLGIKPSMQRDVLGWITLVDVLLSPVGLLAALAAEEHPYLVLLILPLGGLLAVFAAERGARVRQALELSRAYRGTTLLLSDVLDADDEYTGFHSRSVVSLSIAVADQLGLSSAERRNVEFGALLHDVGKIAVPKEIINKPGKLTEEEWLIVKTHTIEGQRMLDQVGGLLSEVGRIVRSSHEKWDGSGYPDGLAGDEIPVGAAIVSCCDAFNAMTTDRPYRAALSLEEALAEVRSCAGSQFSPAVADALVRVLAEDPVAAGGRGPLCADIPALALPAGSGA